ncbi:MAG TPA: long-chain fatty acid--CoA ligase [Thermoanaerobaculia bacterium]|nr:long-chain fatty acid--CoA ligase [Thermoanaerobaculia bacterium]
MPGILDRVTRFLTAPEADSFEDLALAAFAYQFERIEPYRRLCERRGATPETVQDWRQVPPVPAAAFKTLTLAAEPAVEVFRSSGTTGGGGGGGEQRSVHHHPFPDLYRRVIDASFPRFCLPYGGPLPILSLIPTREQLPDSSLSFMADHILARYGSPESATAFGSRGVEAAKARSWAGARQREGRPVLVLATAFALAQWLDALADRLGLKFRLPPGSAVFETGGFKGKTTELTRGELLARVQEWLGVPPDFVVREYGMSELTSQFYTRVLLGGDPDLFVAPHWARVRLLDPETLEEVPAGTPGLVTVFDLANLGSAVHLLTEDLGIFERGEEDGFRLVGRAAGAELRGCSLVVEELRGG